MTIKTLKEKARAYDEALEIARQYWNNRAMPIGTNFQLARMFPELKEESEDERIRKELIVEVKEQIDWISAPDRRREKDEKVLKKLNKWLTWLEKQGKPADINPSEFELRLNNLLKQFESLSKEDLAGTLSFYLNVVQNNGTYKPDEKQVEQKPYGQRKECVGCQFNYAGECKGYCDLKRNELANEDEPKFKVGDWMVYEENVYQIHNISLKKYYECLRSDDTVHIFDFEYIDSKSHLWTIQDAKDGDVLCCESGWTCIFKTLVNDETFSSYCFMDKTKWFCEAGCECHTLREEFMKAYNGKIFPATKKQCDTLMKAMANAGYTFDFEKKELRKIEQKPAESIKEYDFHGIKFIPKFAKGYIIKDKKSGEVSTIEDFSYDTGLYTHTYGQFPITIQDNYEIIGPKQVWNEEDDYNLQCIIAKVTSDIQKGNVGRNNELIDWLKYLKVRITPQPKQEWGEEDERNASYICAALDCYYRLREDRNNTNGQEDLDKARNWLYNRLKSLNPQNRWKVVDKKIYVKEPALAQRKDKSEPNHGYVICYDHTLTPDVYERYIMLSDINCHSEWKPSEEQIEALEKVLKYFHMAEAHGKTIDGLKELLEQLLEQLKSLKEE